ncbi:MAG: P-loop NTPase fold protein [Oscillospiraceae bacterium]|nr:P-loop NTPase fold protein [Oscillospiraceae bacterium]
MDSAIADVIQTGTGYLPIIKDETPLDILNRQDFVNRIVDLLEILSDNKSSCTFALNGAWGTGKTFLLKNLLEPRLESYMDGEKYLVFHYNCWEYDYYEEPLVALATAIKNSSKEQNRLLSTETIAIIEKVANDLFYVFEGVAALTAKAPAVATAAMAGKFKNCIEKLKTKEKEAPEYDMYFNFQKVIQKARKGISKLAEDHTIVIIVDELDRCLPPYAIKVLERLHHLFYELENTVVILAVDKGQLEHTVEQIYGKDTTPDAYLKKFVSFYLHLDAGRVNSGFAEKYADYVSLFDADQLDTTFSLEKYFSALFSGIDGRTLKILVERIKLVHTLLFQKERKNYSFMCFELMWIIISKYYCFDSCFMPIVYETKNGGFSFSRSIALSEKQEKADFIMRMNEYFDQEWKTVHVKELENRNLDVKSFAFEEPYGIPQLLLYYLQGMNNDNTFKLPPDFEYGQKLNRDIFDFKEVDKMLKIIQ